jgi:hypothetical protein
MQNKTFHAQYRRVPQPFGFPDELGGVTQQNVRREKSVECTRLPPSFPSRESQVVDPEYEKKEKGTADKVPDSERGNSHIYIYVPGRILKR